MGEIVQKELSEMVLGIAFCIHNELGAGLLEAVYEEAFCVELKARSIQFERQKRFPVFYRGVLVGDYFADLIVNGKVLLELKAVKGFSEAMEAQILNYLALSHAPVGYLLNFHGPRVQWKRYVGAG